MFVTQYAKVFVRINAFSIKAGAINCSHHTALAKQEGPEMSTSMGMASVFVLSSMMLSPLAMAEESPAFIAKNEARAAAFEQRQTELAASHQNDVKSQQTQVKVSPADEPKDS